MSTTFSGTTFINNGPPAVNANRLNAVETYLSLISTSGLGSVARADLADLSSESLHTLNADLATKANVWSSTINYSINDFVTYSGSLYYALTTNSGVNPKLDINNTTWQVFKSGSSGSGITYTQNPDFESNINSWNTYSGLKQYLPVTGSGGTSALTLTRNTTQPLYGLADMIITKGSGNYQGQGFSTDFVTDYGVLGQPLYLNFSYKNTASGIGYPTTSGMGVYIYDKTNLGLLYLSQTDLVNGYGSVINYVGSFQPNTNSRDYRLIYHCQDTVTSGYGLEIDNIYIGPQQKLVGPAIQMEQTYTPTFTGFGTVTNINFTYARRGNKLIGFGRFTCGTPTAVEQRISLPPNLLTDSKLILTLQVCGILITNQNAANTLYTLMEPGVNYITVAAQNSGSNAFTKIVGGFGNGYLVSVTFEVPIDQWATNINLVTDSTEYASNSSSTDANDTTSFVYGSGGSAGIMGVTDISVQRSKRVRFTRPIQPSDLIILEFYMPTSQAWISGFVRAGGSIMVSDRHVHIINDGGVFFQSVNNTDIDVYFNITPDGGTADWNNANLVGMKWRLRKISNGNMAEVPPLVNCNYTNQTTTAAATTLKYDTYVEDTHNAYNKTTGQFTCPLAGLYSIEASFGPSGAGRATLYRNNVSFRLGDTVDANYSSTYSTICRLNKGDYLDIRLDTTLTARTIDYIQITRLGG
jgi:hypothetical protein